MWLLSIQQEGVPNHLLSMFCSFHYAYPRTEPHKAIICDKLEKARLQGRSSSLLSLASAWVSGNCGGAPWEAYNSQ